MSDSQKVEIECLQPDDFAVFGGFGNKDGNFVEYWISGPSVITSFGMQIGNVDITVDTNGTLNIVPKVEKTGVGGFHCHAKGWKRAAELDLVPA